MIQLFLTAQTHLIMKATTTPRIRSIVAQTQTAATREGACTVTGRRQHIATACSITSCCSPRVPAEMSLFVYKHEFADPGCRTCEVHVPAQQAPALAAAASRACVTIACLLSRICGQRSVSIAHPAAPRASQQCVARCVHSNYRGSHACLWVTAGWSRDRNLPTNIPRGCSEGGCTSAEGGWDMRTADPAVCGQQHPVATQTCPAQTTVCRLLWRL